MTSFPVTGMRPRDDLCDPPPDNGPPQPSPVQVAQQMAEAGDIQGLLDLVTNSQAQTLDLGRIFAQLALALDVASRRDPAEFSGMIFRHMATLNGWVMLRL